jgi:hypothetical protein
MAVAYGAGYYARNPIVYNSKLKERTEGKSRRDGVSMNQQIEYVSAFQKCITVDLRWKDAINRTDPLSLRVRSCQDGGGGGGDRR